MSSIAMGDEQYEESFGRIERDGGNGLHKLREMIRAYAHIMTTDFGMCFARLDDRELGEDAARRGSAFQAPLRPRFPGADRRRHRGRLDEPCNPKLAAFAIIGALNGIADWYRPHGDLSVETIAEEFALRLTEGLAARASRVVDARPKTAVKSRKC